MVPRLSRKCTIPLGREKSWLPNQPMWTTDFFNRTPYRRKTYFANDATDGRLIRTVQGAIPGNSLANYTAVLSATRNLGANATNVVSESVFTATGEIEKQFDPRN